MKETLLEVLESITGGPVEIVRTPGPLAAAPSIKQKL